MEIVKLTGLHGDTLMKPKGFRLDMRADDPESICGQWDTCRMNICNKYCKKYCEIVHDIFVEGNRNFEDCIMPTIPNPFVPYLPNTGTGTDYPWPRQPEIIPFSPGSTNPYPYPYHPYTQPSQPIWRVPTTYDNGFYSSGSITQSSTSQFFPLGLTPSVSTQTVPIHKRRRTHKTRYISR